MSYNSFAPFCPHRNTAAVFSLCCMYTGPLWRTQICANPHSLFYSFVCLLNGAVL